MKDALLILAKIAFFERKFILFLNFQVKKIQNHIWIFHNTASVKRSLTDAVYQTACGGGIPILP